MIRILRDLITGHEWKRYRHAGWAAPLLGPGGHPGCRYCGHCDIVEHYCGLEPAGRKRS